MINYNKSKIRVAVLAGGISNEREVSLSTGKQVMDNLDKEKFDAIFYDTKTDLAKLFADANNKQIDVAFIALHGKGGEDGSVQSILEMLKVPYIGSGILASAIGMDKIMSRKLFQGAGILVPKAFNESNVCFPCVVKPSSGGSSIGISIVENQDGLGFKQAIATAKQHDNNVLIEEYVLGTEITVGVLGNKKLKALPVVEIVPKTKFFDYKAKYDANFCEEIVPARISKDITEKAQELAKKVYRVIGCEGFGRVDIIVKDGQLYVLEINTIPGLTSNSLLPKAARAGGISFSKLLEKIINLGLSQ